MLSFKRYSQRFVIDLVYDRPTDAEDLLYQRTEPLIITATQTPIFSIVVGCNVVERAENMSFIGIDDAAAGDRL